MTLDEEIEYYKKLIEENRRNSKLALQENSELYNNYNKTIGIIKFQRITEKNNNIIEKCNQCAKKYEQLVQLLEKLKTFKEEFAEILLYDHELAERKIYEKAYNNAIDDFTKKIAGYGTYDYYGNVIDVLEIAEELKKKL